MTSIRLQRADLHLARDNEVGALQRCNIYQTAGWFKFLEATQRCEPVLAEVLAENERVGWFAGAIVRSGGFRVLGSPLPGWTTAYQGFIGLSPQWHHDALLALRSFAFDQLGCVHLELMDRALEISSIPSGWPTSEFSSFELPLRTDEGATRTDEDLLAGMNQMARRNIRLAERHNLTAIVSTPRSDLVTNLYANLEIAFHRRGQRPTFSAERLVALVETLPPANLLGVEVVLPDGDVASSALFIGRGDSFASFWMGAGRPDLFTLRPNELLMWTGIRAWRDRGAHLFDFGGGGDYKAKFGGHRITIPWTRTSRWRSLEAVRSHAALPWTKYRRRRSS